MSQTVLHLVDYSFHRKIKPAQNLSLVIAGILWIIILPLLFLQNESLARIAAYLMIFSILPISSFLLLSIPFLFKKRTGKALFKDNELKINDDFYTLDQIELTLNIDQHEWSDSSKEIDQKLKSLPKWGNYINVGSNKKIEFEPNQDINNILDSANIKGYEKRPALMVKTADLFNNLMSILWAAS